MMASTGCRIGAISQIKLSDIKYLEKERLHQIFFYTNSREEYYSFTTPECSRYILEYLEFRKRRGERLKSTSPLIRDDFIIDDLLHIENPKPITTYTIEFYLYNTLIRAGIRTVIPQTVSSYGKRTRKEVSANHGFRKFVHTTMANNRISPEVREMLLGHSIGLSGSYYKPTEKEMLTEYLKVVDALTINYENRLSKQVQELKEKNQDSEYVIKGKLQEMMEKNREKDLQIEKMNQEMHIVYGKIETFSKSFKEVDQTIRNTIESKIESRIKEINTEALQTQSTIKILFDIEKKRTELMNKKGFVTREDMLAINETHRDQITSINNRRMSRSSTKKEE